MLPLWWPCAAAAYQRPRCDILSLVYVGDSWSYGALRWRHHGHDSVSNTSLTIVYSTVHSDADQRKHQSSASLAFVRVIHRGPVNSPHKWPVTRKMFPFDDVIMNYVMVSCTDLCARILPIMICWCLPIRNMFCTCFILFHTSFCWLLVVNIPRFSFLTSAMRQIAFD